MNGRGDEPEIEVRERYRRPRQFKIYATRMQFLWAANAEEALSKAQAMGLDVVRVEEVPA